MGQHGGSADRTDRCFSPRSCSPLRVPGCGGLSPDSFRGPPRPAPYQRDIRRFSPASAGYSVCLFLRGSHPVAGFIQRARSLCPLGPFWTSLGTWFLPVVPGNLPIGSRVPGFLPVRSGYVPFALIRGLSPRARGPLSSLRSIRSVPRVQPLGCRAGPVFLPDVSSAPRVRGVRARRGESADVAVRPALVVVLLAASAPRRSVVDDWRRARCSRPRSVRLPP